MMRLVPATLRALAASVAVVPLACGQPTGNARPGTPAIANPPGGLSALYAGDAGLEGHPDVLFVEGFEEATLPVVHARWTDVRNGTAMTFSADVPAGSPGAQSLAIPWSGGGVDTGGHLYKQLSPGVGDRLYVRYYIKYPASGSYSHHGVWMGGYNPPLAWPNPHAGVKPLGSDRFSAAVEQASARFDHYNYWVDMRLSADGNSWGNRLLNDPRVGARTGQWMCVEHMVKLNDPVTTSSGEHAVWLDGVKVSHLGPGFPRGSWSGGIFTQDPAGTPFQGFRWRSDAALDLNWLWLQVYAPDERAGVTGQFKFDHVVAARSYIGCLPAATPSGTAVTRTPAANPWPNEPTGLVPFNDQPWDRLTRPDGPIRGRLGRVLQRIRAVFDPPAEPGPEWSYLRRSSSKDSSIVLDSTAPLSPPGVLRIVFTPDMLPDHEPGVHWIGLPNVREVYAGWWIKVSTKWTSGAGGGGKMTFLHAAPNGRGQVYSGLFGSRAPHRVSVNTEWAPYGQRIWDPNVTTTPINYGQWYRIEWYLKWESTPGAGDGVLRWWVDGTPNADHRNVTFPTHSVGFHQFEFAPTLQKPPEQEQYMYVDHTHLGAR